LEDICDLEDYLRKEKKIDKERYIIACANEIQLKRDAIIWNISTSAEQPLRVKLNGL